MSMRSENTSPPSPAESRDTRPSLGVRLDSRSGFGTVGDVSGKKRPVVVASLETISYFSDTVEVCRHIAAVDSPGKAASAAEYTYRIGSSGSLTKLETLRENGRISVPNLRGICSWYGDMNHGPFADHRTTENGSPDTSDIDGFSNPGESDLVIVALTKRSNWS